MLEDTNSLDAAHLVIIKLKDNFAYFSIKTHVVGTH